MNGSSIDRLAGFEGRRQAIEREWIRPRRLLFVFDIASACIFLLCTQVFLGWRLPADGTTRLAFLAGGILFLLIVVLLLFRDGQYSQARRISRLSDIAGLCWNVVLAAAFTFLLGYLTKGFFTGVTSPSRLVVGGSILVFGFLTVCSRLGLAAYQRRLFARGAGVQRMLVLGTGPAGDEFVQFIEKRPWLGVKCAGRLAYGVSDTSDCPTGPAVTRDAGAAVAVAPALSGLEALDRVLRQTGANEVIVALDEEDRAVLPQVTKMLSVAHVPYRIVPTLFESTFRSSGLGAFVELPVVDVEVDAMARAERLTKRVLDVVIGSCALVVSLPLTLGISLAIVVEDGFPVLFRQERVGKNGRHFAMLKFRTMVKDAEQQLAELQDKNEAGTDLLFKIKDDPRVTRVGKWLRHFSLDEWPQFVNVLRGEMSIVGPRPPLPREVEKYEEQHLCRLRAVPGITGLWQVSGRSDLSFDEMVKLDRYYLENWSVGLDLKIILKTFVVVVGRKGAY